MSNKPQDAPKILMPKATAVWFIENTALDFEQIADFTGLHTIEVQALADEEVGLGIVGIDPIKNNELEQNAAQPKFKTAAAYLRGDAAYQNFYRCGDTAIDGNWGEVAPGKYCYYSFGPQSG